MLPELCVRAKHSVNVSIAGSERARFNYARVLTFAWSLTKGSHQPLLVLHRSTPGHNQVRDVIMMPIFQPVAFSWATAAQYASENFLRVVWPHRRKLVTNSLCLEEWLSRDVSGLYGFRSLSRNVTPWNIRCPCILTTLTFQKQSRIFIKTQQHVRPWQPNRCLVPPTSSGNEQKWKGY